MGRNAFCAYGAEQTLAVLEVFAAIRPDPKEPSLAAVEAWRRAAVRLQACLTLFAPCLPPTRVAFWKRRLRRLLRALNALCDHLRLLQTIDSPGRIRLRLQQRVESLLQKAHMAWERLHREHIPNEIRGLATRWASGKWRTMGDALQACAQARWAELARMNLKWLGGEAPTQGAAHALETRWGRLQLMVEVAEQLAPLLGEELPLQSLQAYYRELDALRFRARAIEQLTQLKEAERALTLHYQGHLRGFHRIEQEFNRWIEHFRSEWVAEGV
ncbi:MAG: hypothetical protein NZL85_02240 [Fimbriimonadales bacterium]|nr:hypothetical protein [Fimbriimonadales bacterium]